jgi:serine phosphatase RsbU (regulator of sigma subunit)
MDPTGAFYGEERLFRKLSSQRKRSLDPACGRLIEDLYAFGRGSAIRDDVTLLGIEFTGAS